MPTVPTYDHFFTPTLQALRNLGGSASNEEILEEVSRILELPDDVLAVEHGDGGKSEVEYRLSWARTYLKKNGLLENSRRGVWSLTPEGAKTESVDPEAIKRRVQEDYRARKSRKKTSERQTSDREEGDIPEVIEEEEVDAWREHLHSVLLSMDPIAFERLCQRLLRESGFIEVDVTKRSGDGGIDGHGIIRINGLISFPVLFQCKRYRDVVSSPTVRDFRGAMIGRADKGIIITTGSFTRDARAEATRDGAPPVDLIDGDLLMDKLKELGLGVTTRMVEEVVVNEEWFEVV